MTTITAPDLNHSWTDEELSQLRHLQEINSQLPEDAPEPCSLYVCPFSLTTRRPPCAGSSTSGGRPTRTRHWVLELVKAFLKAGVLTEDGRYQDT